MANAAANMIPFHRPTPAELRAEDQQGIAADRRERILALQAEGDQCRPPVAHELVKALVLDGQVQIARTYADDYEQRCGTDPDVRAWGDAPTPHKRGS